MKSIALNSHQVVGIRATYNEQWQASRLPCSIDKQAFTTQHKRIAFTILPDIESYLLTFSVVFPYDQANQYMSALLLVKKMIYIQLLSDTTHPDVY